MAEIRKSGQRTHLVRFQTQQEAALAYNAAVSHLGYPTSWLDETMTSATPEVQIAMTTTTKTPPPARRLWSLHAPNQRADADSPAHVRADHPKHPLLPLWEEPPPSISRRTGCSARQILCVTASAWLPWGLQGLHEKQDCPPSTVSPSPPPRPHPAPAAARSSTSKSAAADSFNIGATDEEDSGEGGMMPAASPSATALEAAAMEARIEALEAKGQAAIAVATAEASIKTAQASVKTAEAQATVKLAEADAKAALAEVRDALAEKRLSAHGSAAPRAHC